MQLHQDRHRIHLERSQSQSVGVEWGGHAGGIMSGSCRHVPYRQLIQHVHTESTVQDMPLLTIINM